MPKARKNSTRWKAVRAAWLKAGSPARGPQRGSRVGGPAARQPRWGAKGWHTPWSRRLIVAAGVVVAALVVVFFYYYLSFSRQIDARLHGERERVLPRVFARPLELHQGEAVTDRQLIDRLNDLGYAQKGRTENIGEFSETDGVVTLMPRGGPFRGRLVRATFQRVRPPRTSRRQAPGGGEVTGPVTRLDIVDPSTPLRADGERS